MYARDHGVIATPVGQIRVEGDDEFIVGVTILAEPAPLRRPDSRSLMTAIEQIEQWFAGDRHLFELPLQPPATPRGETLRNGLIDVGYGKTMSYGALATLLQSSPRAIGQLCARNPYPIIVPCHRIVGNGGAIGNYSAGHGTVTKLWLLDHERRHALHPETLI